MSGENRSFGLNGNVLKIIAAISMLVDHIGVIFFPTVIALRIIGRFAFPIFAYMIAEGCNYTKNKLRYFLNVFVLGVGCQLVYSLYGGDEMMGILITFSISILVIYAMQYMKKLLFSEKVGAFGQALSVFVFIAAVAAAYVLNEIFYIDYGFWGCMAPVFASVFRVPREMSLPYLEKLDKHVLHVSLFGVGLAILSFAIAGTQPYALFALPLLFIYSGKRGKLNMKYFFYIFYPLHLAVLELINYIID